MIFNKNRELLFLVDFLFVGQRFFVCGVCLCRHCVNLGIEVTVGFRREGKLFLCQTVDEETAAANGVPVGCRIEELTKGAPADQAGLKVGDIITKANDVTVAANDDVVDYIRSLKVGDTVDFTVYRDGEYLTITVTIGDMNRFSD